jgi:iron(II)-dependent oxidoreductase
MEDLAIDLEDSRARLLELALDLDDDHWMGPRLAIVNPMRWEIGHVAWFQEKWILREGLGCAPLLAEGDALYDSARVHHDTRWDLSLPPRDETLAYMRAVLHRSLEAVRAASDAVAYFARLATYHEDMHGEALAYTRQTLGYPAPRFVREADRSDALAGPWPGDVDVPGGVFALGAEPGRDPFVFDNEKWAHPVEVAPFRIARAPVTNAELSAFVESGGYRDDACWSDEGRRWRDAVGARMPVYWREGPDGYEVRRYDAWGAVSPHQPAIHVCWFEAEAFARFAGRRLPTEAEWELAATTFDKRRFPWGHDAPTRERACLDGASGRPVDVAARAAGDSAYGCRQMIGNVWEWTASDLRPFPGFVLDPYKEYSKPWFHSPHKVLRGGCWATRARLLRGTWRNFYPPHRRDVLAGFRTCAA